MIVDGVDRVDNKHLPRPAYPELAANAALVLLAVACSLLDRQLAAQAAAFATEGGFTERLHRVRSQRRLAKSTKSTKP